MARSFRLVGLGLLVGAVLHGTAQAQRPTPRDTTTRRDTTARRDTTTRRDTTARRDTIVRLPADSLQLRIPVPSQVDSVLRDSLRRIDSLRALRRESVRRDTIKAPITRSEAPPPREAMGAYVWTRDSIYTTGAVTLAELLNRVPGITTLNSGYIASPAVAGWMGNLTRVRVFYDGIEIPPLDPRAGSVPDLSWVPLWTLEEVRVERGASEARVWLRSWRVDRTTPSSRVDAATGDQRTNLFRGYFGRRYTHGEVLQAGGQEFSTTPPLLGSSSDQLGLFARVGIARPGWSLDGFVLRTTAHRGVQYRLDNIFEANPPVRPDSIPALDANQTNLYARFGWGDPETTGPWFQAIGAFLGYGYEGRQTRVHLIVPSDTVDVLHQLDTLRTYREVVLTGGWSAGPVRLSIADRVFWHRGTTTNVPTGRASFDTRFLGATIYAEGKGVDSTSRIEASARLTPFTLLSFAGAVGRMQEERGRPSGRSIAVRPLPATVSGNYARAEAALNLWGLYVGGGLLRRDPALLLPPSIFSSDSMSTLADSLARRVEPSANGVMAQVRGRLYKSLYANAYAIRWDSGGFYRPEWQTFSELYISTTLPKKFPSRNLGLKFLVSHEYRSTILVPEGLLGTRSEGGYRVLTGLIEIRLLDATLSYQYRNLLGEIYAQVPGYRLPRQTQYYGVRWNFFN